MQLALRVRQLNRVTGCVQAANDPSCTSQCVFLAVTRQKKRSLSVTQIQNATTNYGSWQLQAHSARARQRQSGYIVRQAKKTVQKYFYY